jgi:hypothetical protein
MNIIFGDTAKQIPNGYTVLELDTVRRPPNSIPVTAYCVIEKIPLQEFPLVESNKILHADIIRRYRERDWDFCLTAMQTLFGKWNGELDSFYTELTNRIESYREAPPPTDWDGTYQR